MAADSAEQLGPRELEEAGAPLRVRAFFGLPVPDEQGNLLGSYLAACTPVASEFRWTPAANLHLTVRFIGSVERAGADLAAARLAELPLSGFTLELGEGGTCKRGRLVRVVWLDGTARAAQDRALAAHVQRDRA